MKALYSLALLVFLSFSAFSQNAEVIIYEGWNNSSWDSTSQTLNSFDTNGYLLNSSDLVWDAPSSSWMNGPFKTYTYDANGNLLQSVTHEWNNGALVNKDQELITYTATGKEETFLSQEWINGAWLNTSKVTMTYDLMDYRSAMLTENWDTASGTWKNLNRYTYINNGNGTPQQAYYETWNLVSGTWAVYLRHTYTYSAAWKPVSVLTEMQMPTGWRNLGRKTYTYDPNDFLINYLEESFNNTSQLWSNSNQINYTNDASGLVQQYVRQLWNNPTSSWKNLTRITYLYPTALGTAASLTGQVALYPNPATEQLTIRLPEAGAQLTVQDATGQALFYQITAGTEQLLTIGHLSPGLYLLKTETAAGTSVRRFRKE